MPLVQTRQGKLQGISCENVGVKYFAFKGIPYAQPPIGDLRFKAPQPPVPWAGVRDASAHGPVCPQYNERMDRIDEGNEDCLYLSVYAPTLTPSKPLPVMVWIHGGGFYTGSGNSDFYGPEFFMTHNVILVTFNYRLEALGFLCLDNEEVPGNAGMKDQVAALKWVKENIASFGGDSNNITIFGCSAGGASTAHHLVSKMSRGLFNKAICQSGVCLNEWSYNIYARQRAFQLGKLLGKETDDPDELLSFLRSVPALSLVNINLPGAVTMYKDITDSIYYGPVIEKCGLDKDKFLEKSPVDLVKMGRIANVPVILGYTSGDGIEIARKLSSILSFYDTFGALIPRELKYKLSPQKLKSVNEKIRKHYFGDEKLTMKLEQEVVDFETDRMFAYNTRRFARYHSMHCTQPTYLYKFTAETERNYNKKRYKMDHVKGVCHGDEITYLFNASCIDVPLTDESRPLIDQFVRLWTNFASTGSPTPHEGTENWTPFTEDEQNCFLIGKSLECVRNEDSMSMLFWDDIYGEVQLNSSEIDQTQQSNL